jgi:hypothetical protein
MSNSKFSGVLLCPFLVKCQFGCWPGLRLFSNVVLPMQISSQQHLVLYLCNTACNIVSETQRKEIINLAKKHFICSYTDTLFMNTLYYWQYNILFILKYKQKVHVKIKVTVVTYSVFLKVLLSWNSLLTSFCHHTIHTVQGWDPIWIQEEQMFVHK